MPDTWTTSPWVMLALLGLLASALVVWQPAGAAPVMLGLGALLGLLALGRRLPGLALGFLAFCLLGYALLGRGFAYLGAPPLFVGEAALALGLLALGLTGGLRGLVASPPLYPLLALLLTGAAATLPYIGIYGIDAFRDAALWGYGFFALIAAGLLLRGDRAETTRAGGGRAESRVLGAARGYVRYAPLFLLWMPVALVISELYADVIPLTPGSDIPLLDLKGGDVAVHLAGIAALLLLGLPRLLAAGRARGVRLGSLSLARTDWLWWALWFAAAAIPLFRVRAGLLAVAAAVLVVLLFRPGTRWWKPLVLVVVMMTSFVAFNVQITVGGARNTISAESLLLNIQSITQSTGEGDRDGSRRWRLLWWGDIVDYTVRGPYFWTGKGYGVNLADADGYQLGSGELRSPHNGHLTILARSGVPGLAAWLLVQGLFVFGLLRAYRRATAAGQELWARLNLWVLAYWAAFMVNATFDVFLEGPQGGIWFWALFGFGLALLEVQRRQWRQQEQQARRQALPLQPPSALEAP